MPSMVAELMTPLMPGAGPPPTSNASLPVGDINQLSIFTLFTGPHLRPGLFLYVCRVAVCLFELKTSKPYGVRHGSGIHSHCRRRVGFQNRGMNSSLRMKRLGDKRVPSATMSHRFACIFNSFALVSRELDQHSGLGRVGFPQRPFLPASARPCVVRA